MKKRVPWNKGKSGLQVAWNKGKKQSETHRENNRLSHIGQKAWNKGKKRWWKSSSEFKKGQTAHNKGIYTSEKMAAIHYWARITMGMARKCEYCGTETAKVYNWANKDHKYNKNPEDWMRLCRSCHMKYDYKYNNRK